jgi:hypothetical protein
LLGIGFGAVAWRVAALGLFGGGGAFTRLALGNGVRVQCYWGRSNEKITCLNLGV